jgi:hypothetical protein
MSTRLPRTLGRLLPPLRRLHDHRNALLAECEALRAEAAGLRQRLGAVEAAARADAELAGARAEGRLILTEYGYRPRSRPIEAAAFGAQLSAHLEANEARYATMLHGILAGHLDALRRIPRRADGDRGDPFWENDWFQPLDGAVLYGLIAELSPRRFVEVGSGMSTRFARRAIRDRGLPTEIVSIDPHPHTEVDAICDEVIRHPVEDLGREFWDGLAAGDLLFVDNSHRSFPNSDVTVFFAETLPALQEGVAWGLHDIFLPWDYPSEWGGRFYNEQYLLLAYLAGGGGEDEILLPVMWASRRPSLHGILAPLWGYRDLFHGISTHGGAFWMRRNARPRT